jgi:protein SMG7
MSLELYIPIFSCRLNVDGRNKLSVSEYVAVFLKLHGFLHNSLKLQEAEKYVKLLTMTLTAHVATESLTSWKLVQVCSNFHTGGT